MVFFNGKARVLSKKYLLGDFNLFLDDEPFCVLYYFKGRDDFF